MNRDINNSWLNNNTIGFAIASFFSDFCYEMANIILPSFVSQLFGSSAAPVILGLITGLSNLVASLLKLISGWLSDHLNNRKPMIFLGYLITGIFIGLLGTATKVWQLISYRTLAWTGKGLREPARDAILSESVNPDYYGRTFGVNRAMDTLGAIAGPLLVFFIIRYFKLSTIFYISAIPGLIAALVILYYVFDNRIQSNAKFSWNLLTQIKSLPPSFIYFAITMFIFGISNFNKLLIILRAQQVMGNGSTELLSKWTILLYIIFNIIRFISEFLIGFLSDFINKQYLLSFCGFGLFGFTSIALIFHINNIWWLGFIFIIAAISTATITTLEKAYAAELLPIQLRGIGYGVLQTLDGIGDLISNVIVGLLWSIAASWVGFIYSALFSFIAMVLLYKHNN